MYLILFWLLAFKKEQNYDFIYIYIYIYIYISFMEEKAQCIFKYYPGIPQLH